MIQDTVTGSLLFMDKHTLQVEHTIKMLEEKESFKIVSYENSLESVPEYFSLVLDVAVWEESGKVTVAWGAFWSVQVAHIEESSLKGWSESCLSDC